MSADTVFGAIFIGAGAIFIAAVAVMYTADQRTARRRAAAKAAQPAGRTYEASAYQPANNLCHVEGCGQAYRYDIHGWRLCTDCRDELEARHATEAGEDFKQWEQEVSA